VPVRALGLAFLAGVGATPGEATQAVGALLLLGLLAAPAAAWAGLVIAYVVPSLPPSFSITAVAAGLYAGAGFFGLVLEKRRRLRGVELTDGRDPAR
jgi:zinc/manganese transport system permease protein